MLEFLVVLVGVVVFAFASSTIMDWASGHSAMWSMGAAAILVVTGTILLAIAAILVSRAIVN